MNLTDAQPATRTDARQADTARSLRVLMYMFFPGGGIGRYTHELATELNQLADVDVELACLQEFHHREEAEYSVWPGLFSISSSNPLIRKARFLAAQYISPRRAIRHAVETCADVIHFSNINHLTFPVWKQALADSSCLVTATAHDVRRAKSILNRKWEEAALQSFYQTCDALFVHSTSQVEDLQAFADIPASRIHVVPHGIYAYGDPGADRDTLRARYNIPQDRVVLLCFGGIRDDKNLEQTLLAMKDVPDRPFLLIAGRGGSKGQLPVEHYQQRVEEWGLMDDVQFMHRFIADDEVGPLFHLSDLVMLTYRTGFTSQSGVLNVAMHYGKPVLSTPAPTMAETIHNYQVGVVCKDDSADAIAVGYSEWLQSRDRFSQSSFDRYTTEHSWHRNATLTNEVYRSLLLQRSVPEQQYSSFSPVKNADE